MTSFPLFIALDVDDQAFQVAFFNSLTLESGYFNTKPRVSALLAKLEKLKGPSLNLKVCDEATYLGFSLCRELRKKGIDCEVIASSLIPELAGKVQKTDRIDAEKLVQFYARDLLTVVHVPDQEQESDRDLIRSRKFLNDQLRATKLSIKSLCRRYGLYPKEESEKPLVWSDEYLAFIRRKLPELPKSTQFTLETLLFQINQLEALERTYEQEIELLANTPQYQKQVSALCCFRGVKTFTAMTLVTEIGDVRRFAHPKELVSYAGMDLREYSSGGKERRSSISKLENRHITTALVESAQFAIMPPRLSRDLKKRRLHADIRVVSIADRCMVRLHKKGSRLIHKNKPRNKAKIACAREMLCFIWETLKITSVV